MSQNAMLVARKPSCRDASAFFFYQIKADLAEITPKNHQNVQETPFSRKAPGVNGLSSLLSLQVPPAQLLALLSKADHSAVFQ